MIERAKFSDFRISIWLSINAELTGSSARIDRWKTCTFPVSIIILAMSRIERRRYEKVDDSKSDRQRHDRQNEGELPTNKSNDLSE